MLGTYLYLSIYRYLVIFYIYMLGLYIINCLVDIIIGVMISEVYWRTLVIIYDEFKKSGSLKRTGLFNFIKFFNIQCFHHSQIAALIYKIRYEKHLTYHNILLQLIFLTSRIHKLL